MAKNEIKISYLPAQIKSETSELRIEGQKLADKIIDVCEKIQASVKGKDEINGFLTEIVEACHFQDFLGQRLEKIEKFIDEVDIGFKNLGVGVSVKERDYKDSLLNGPAAGSKPSQEDIDKLFDND